MCNKTNQKRRKWFYAAITDGEGQHASLWTTWKTILCGRQSYSHGLVAVLRFTEDRQDLAHVKFLLLCVARFTFIGYFPVGYWSERLKVFSPILYMGNLHFKRIILVKLFRLILHSNFFINIFCFWYWYINDYNSY